MSRVRLLTLLLALPGCVPSGLKELTTFGGMVESTGSSSSGTTGTETSSTGGETSIMTTTPPGSGSQSGSTGETGGTTETGASGGSMGATTSFERVYCFDDGFVDEGEG
jgi:hypothetical protein